MPLTEPTAFDESIDQQLEYLKSGTQYVKLLRAASAGDGIHQVSREFRNDYIRAYDESLPNLEVIKFVPASGAATRMFRKVFQWIEIPEKHKKEINQFFKKAEQLPFFEAWVSKCNELDVETFEGGMASKVKWLNVLVSQKGLNYSNMPKGLIPFHQYDTVVTPIHDHLLEAKEYGCGKKGARLVFSISEEHQAQFAQQAEAYAESLFESGDDWSCEFTFQDASTDTVCLNEQGEIYKSEDGNPVKRPGGHGALIYNLNALDADLIFIKNIDNVVHKRLLQQTVMHKKLIGGMLLQLRQELMALHEQVSKGLVDATSIDQVREKWNLRVPRDYVKLKEYLKRPIRVCGMVKNEGEPGGGPFWCLDKYTGESVQIIEQSQIDKANMRQEMIMNSAAYFNPVDIVCCVRNLQGEKIDLLEFRDPNQYFTAEKSLNQESIRVLEWPGLWNGAMSKWISVYVEVPNTTFNPVKEVSDLMRPNHLPSP